MSLRTMKRMPHIMAAMTPFPYHVGIRDSVKKANEMMAEHDVRHLPVKDGDALVGVLTAADIERALDPSTQMPPPEELCVEDICVLEAYIVGHTEPLDTVVLYMAETRIDSALVVKEDRLVGIFTMTDAFRYLGDLLRSEFRAEGGDSIA